MFIGQNASGEYVMNFYQCTPKMVENRTEDVFFEEYYTNGPEFKWKYDYRQLRRASELMYVCMKYLNSLADPQCLHWVDYRDR